MSKKHRRTRFMLTSLCFLILSFVLGLSLGTVQIPIKEIWGILMRGPHDINIGEDMHALILWRLRFPRVCLALIEGAALAVAGGVMQGLFRNPMADPYILGVSSGASLGAVVGMAFGVGRVLGVWSLPGLAFLGAAITTFIVYTLATHKGRTDTWTLLLSGIAISSLVSSLIAVVMVLKREKMDEIVFWTMGGLSRASWNSVFAALPYAVIGMVALLSQSRALNVMSYGEVPAFHMGVGIQQAKKKLLWLSALITASGVAFTGPIGFVGLIVPHAVRLIIGPDHTWLLPMSGVMGGGSLIMADLLARTIQPPMEVPVGVVTALFGAPFFLYLLFKVKRRPKL